MAMITIGVSQPGKIMLAQKA